MEYYNNMLNSVKAIGANLQGLAGVAQPIPDNILQKITDRSCTMACSVFFDSEGDANKKLFASQFCPKIVGEVLSRGDFLVTMNDHDHQIYPYITYESVDTETAIAELESLQSTIAKGMIEGYLMSKT